MSRANRGLSVAKQRAEFSTWKGHQKINSLRHLSQGSLRGAIIVSRQLALLDRMQGPRLLVP